MLETTILETIGYKTIVGKTSWKNYYIFYRDQIAESKVTIQVFDQRGNTNLELRIFDLKDGKEPRAAFEDDNDLISLNTDLSQEISVQNRRAILIEVSNDHDGGDFNSQEPLNTSFRLIAF